MHDLKTAAEHPDPMPEWVRQTMRDGAEAIRRLIETPPEELLPETVCKTCGKKWERFQERSTCGYGGCPWGGDF